MASSSRYVPSAEVKAMFPRVRATVDAARGKVLSVQLTKTDFMQLGRMFSTDGIPGYGASMLRVVAASPLFYLLKMLLDDPGFCVGLSVPEHFDLLSLPTMRDNELDVTFVMNVPADMVWAALAFAVEYWGKSYGVGALRYTSQMDEAEFIQFLGRFQYIPADEQAIVNARRTAPEAVNTVYDALLRSSALLAVVVKNQSKVSDNVGDRPACDDPNDLPDVPTEPPADDEDLADAEEKPKKPVLRQLTNEEVADELCAFILSRSERAPEAMRDNAPRFCQTVRKLLGEFAKNGLNVAEMDGFTQGKYLESGAAQAVAMAYTMCSAEHNPYLVNVIDTFLLAEPHKADEPDKEWDAKKSESDETHV